MKYRFTGMGFFEHHLRQAKVYGYTATDKGAWVLNLSSQDGWKLVASTKVRL